MIFNTSLSTFPNYFLKGIMVEAALYYLGTVIEIAPTKHPPNGAGIIKSYYYENTKAIAYRTIVIGLWHLKSAGIR